MKTEFFDINNLVRQNIKDLKPYSSARSEFKGEASVFLDANENSFGSPGPENYNRYPDPLQWKLKAAISEVKGLPLENIFIGNGSDEVIDLAFRIFCEPGKDNVIICPPTYGMYEVSANINNVAAIKVPLTKEFQLDTKSILQMTDDRTKLLFICSPNNPTGNSMSFNDVEFLLNNFPGLVIIDEAYINYSRQRSFIRELTEYPNLLVMQTFSKAWGLAGLRLGMCFASAQIIDLYNKVKPPYNIGAASQELALNAVTEIELVNKWVKEAVEEREYLKKRLTDFSFVKEVFPSDANFILLRVDEATNLYNYLAANKIIVRNRTKDFNCENCIRITVGTPLENEMLIKVLNSYKA
jgi:histidinol-phosphate aminotransferase